MNKSKSKKTTPKTQKNESKDKVVSIRFAHEEYLTISDQAEKAGLTFSEFVRKSARRTSDKPRVIPEINRYAYLELSNSLQEFSNFLKMIKYNYQFADLRNGVIEKTLVKIVTQIFEVKRNLL